MARKEIHKMVLSPRGQDILLSQDWSTSQKFDGRDQQEQELGSEYLASIANFGVGRR